VEQPASRRASRARDRLTGLVIRVLSYREHSDGRILVAAILSVYFLIIAIPRLVWRVDIWPTLGVPSRPLPFVDTKNVLAALDCRRLGFDPLVHNPCDPLGRPMNYPRVWLALRWLGLNQSQTNVIGVAVVLIFLASLYLLIGRITIGQGFAVALAVTSPSVMFGIERGQMDLIVFAIVVSAVVVWHRATLRAAILSPVLIFLAATTKLFPVFGLGAYLFTRDRRPAFTATFLAAAFGAYVALTIDDIRAVARIAPQGQYHSFGARILISAVYHDLLPGRSHSGEPALALIPLALMGGIFWLWLRRRLVSSEQLEITPALLSLYIGSLIYLGTFATINSFDYRLVILLLGLPQLFEWITRGSNDRRSLSCAALASILFLLWVGPLAEPLRLWDELASWLTAGLLMALLAQSIPPMGEIIKSLRPRLVP
jgi:hypothetical protein